MDKTTDPGIQLFIKRIPRTANESTVTRQIAKVLHADDFKSFTPGRPMNFQVKLNMENDGSYRNKGTGYLTLPFRESGYKFLSYVRVDPIKIESAHSQQPLQFEICKRKLPPHDVETLAMTRYVSPDLEEDHQNTLRALEGSFRVDKVQFGVFYKDKFSSRAFSVEWERDYVKSYASLSFDYDHKLFRLELGSSLTDTTYYGVSLSFSSIKQIVVGTDVGSPYICFETYTPPILDNCDIYRDPAHSCKFKQRISSLDDAHAVVSPYTPHLRLQLHPRDDYIPGFRKKCKEAGILDPLLVHSPLEACGMKFFSPKRLYTLQKILEGIQWPIAFQLECLLRNGLLNTDEFHQLMPMVKSLVHKYPANSIGELLRCYIQALRGRQETETATDCFQRTLPRFASYSYSVFRARNNSSRSKDLFRCYHITFTPTLMVLEGPYPTQSNQVIRKYTGFDDHFIRVEFRDESGLSYQWQPEIDRMPFLENHIGGILKSGFTLAGRRFQFLAWSNSSLREHAFWFLHPFETKDGLVNSQSIRDSVGDFAGDPLMKTPWKYAARIGQHFTSTYPSVTILRNEWEEIEDLECPEYPEEKYLFTDGVGSISRDLASRIWAKSCENGGFVAQTNLEASAYQIRFLGYKGVVVVDEELDETGNGIHMRLRKSMRKFDVKNDEIAVIEIAQYFNRPIPTHLNRNLIMTLEDIGVRKEAFLDLQAAAIADAYCIGDSMQRFESAVRAHSFGSAFGLSDLLLQLRETLDVESVHDPFLRKLQRTAVDDILHNIKYSARIPIPDSFQYVGVADEGPAYERRGYKNVYCLNEGEICVCIQRQADTEHIWLKGDATISRSPIAHIGDVQRVRLIGEPPKDMVCFFRHLRNVVVLPSKGNRSLASCLSGGDLDGDTFDVICYETLLPINLEEPASYKRPKERPPLVEDCTANDLCDFAVEYIGWNVIGQLSEKLLVMADQSSDGMRDRRCQLIGKLCSQAVDFSKQGTPVSLKSVPPLPIRPKPDWKDTRPPSDCPRKGDSDFYESNRALGYLFRAVSKPKRGNIPEESPCTNPMSDQITGALLNKVQDHLGTSALVAEYAPQVADIFNSYQDELRYICSTHTLSFGEDISESEVVIGTILAASVEKTWRKRRMNRMRELVQVLVEEKKQVVYDSAGIEGMEGPGVPLRVLRMAWNAWIFSVSNRKEFGANSFSLIALSVVLDCLGRLAGSSLSQ